MHPMVIKAPWNRDQLMYDGGVVEKMLRFEVQSPTKKKKKKKGGNPHSSAEAEVCERETNASALSGFLLRVGGNVW